MNGSTRARHRGSVRWLKRLFSEAPPPPPVLLRVAEPSGAPAPIVDVAVTWFPSRLEGARTHRTAQGLCVIPWLGDEERARIAVRTGSGEAVLELDRDRHEPDRVCDVPLRGAARPSL